MIKVLKILESSPYKLVCSFSNGEIRELDVEEICFKDSSSSIVAKLKEPHIFETATVGSMGQILWPDAATMKDETGRSQPCEYDISPEFAYQHSR